MNTSPLSPDDELNMLEYIDGTLTPAAKAAFEAELDLRPDLRQSTNEQRDLETFIRQRMGEESAPTSRSNLRLVGGFVAVAAAILLLVVQRPWRSQEPLEVRSAVLASAPSPLDLNRVLGLGEDERRTIPEEAADMGAGDPNIVSITEYRDLIMPLQRDRARGAIDGQLSNVSAASFLIPVEVNRSSSAVVFIVDSRGIVRGTRGQSWRVAFPVSDEWSDAALRLPASQTTFLPGPNVASDASNGPGVDLEFSPGFAAPAHFGPMTVLLGVRCEEVSVELQSKINGVVAQLEAEAEHSQPRSAETLREVLETEGFATSTLQVNPKSTPTSTNLLSVRAPAEKPIWFSTAVCVETNSELFGVKTRTQTTVQEELGLSAKPDPKNTSSISLTIAHGDVTAEIEPLGKSFNTAEDAGDPPPILRPFVLISGKSYSAVISESGVFESVSGYAKHLEDAIPTTGSVMKLAEFRDDLRRNSLQRMIVPLPPQVIRVGMTWRAEFPYELFDRTIQFRPTCKIVRLTESEVEWEINTPEESKVTDPKLPDARVEDPDTVAWISASTIFNSASLNGRAVVSLADGLPLSVETTVQLDIVPGEPSTGLLIPMKVTDKITVQRRQ